MANSKVQIAVLDENEFTPKFMKSEYIFDINLPISAGNLIGKVKAIDQDFTDRNQLSYNAVSGLFLKYFFRTYFLKLLVLYNYF